MGGLADERPPIPYDRLTPRHALFDMIYNPAETPFLLAGRLRGAPARNGLGMLHRQAELSLEVWQAFAWF
jgi:shikimate dehydrogenase